MRGVRVEPGVVAEVPQQGRRNHRTPVAILPAFIEHFVDGGQVIRDAPGFPVPREGNRRVHEALDDPQLLRTARYARQVRHQVGQHRVQPRRVRLDHRVGVRPMLDVAREAYGIGKTNHEHGDRQHRRLDRRPPPPSSALKSFPGVPHTADPIATARIVQVVAPRHGFSFGLPRRCSSKKASMNHRHRRLTGSAASMVCGQPFNRS